MTNPILIVALVVGGYLLLKDKMVANELERPEEGPGTSEWPFTCPKCGNVRETVEMIYPYPSCPVCGYREVEFSDPNITYPQPVPKEPIPIDQNIPYPQLKQAIAFAEYVYETSDILVWEDFGNPLSRARKFYACRSYEMNMSGGAKLRMVIEHVDPDTGSSYEHGTLYWDSAIRTEYIGKYIYQDGQVTRMPEDKTVGTIIVKFLPGVPGSRTVALHKSFSVLVISHSEIGKFDVVTVPPHTTMERLIQDYLSSGLVEYAEPNVDINIWPGSTSGEQIEL